MTRYAKSVEELFPLVAFARAGDLKAVKAWIDSGSPLNLPKGLRTKRQSALQIAIEKGFLTLAEVLLDGGADPGQDCALQLAVRRDRPDIARLLLDRGVPPGDVDFEEVCFSENLELVRLFLERGADPVTRSPFYHALSSGLQPLIGLVKELLAKDPSLQPQVDAVLAHYAEKANPRGVSLLMWAGAKPDAELPAEGDPESRETPLEVAARSGNLATFKTMKPEAYPMLLPRMLRAASGDQSRAIAEYLFTLGAPVNDQADGTSTLLELALWRVGLHSGPGITGFPETQRVANDIANVETLLAKGAKFRPMNARELRHQLKSVSCENLIRLIGIFQRAAAFPNEVLLETISTPKMREILGNRWPSASRIAVGEPPAQPAKPSPKALVPEAPQDRVELRQRAEEALAAFIRKQGHIPFMERCVSKHWTRGEFRRSIKLTDPRYDEVDILKDASKSLNKRLKSVSISLEEPTYYPFPQPTFRLSPKSSWNEAVREVCEIPEDEPLPLTPSAERFLSLAETGGTRWHSEEVVRKRVGGSKYTRVAHGLAEEIAAKRGVTINVTRRQSSSQPRGEELKLEIAAKKSPEELLRPVTVINLKWDRPMKSPEKVESDLFRDGIVNLLLKAKLAGSEPFTLFRIHTPHAVGWAPNGRGRP